MRKISQPETKPVARRYFFIVISTRRFLKYPVEDVRGAVEELKADSESTTGSGQDGRGCSITRWHTESFP
jgi:hypothetical protein